MGGSRAYATVVAAAVVLTLGNNLPTPLYSLYRQQFGLSPTTLTVVYAAYSTALVPLLLFFGPLGDAIGRRRSLLISALISLTAMLVLAFARDVDWLVAGRVLQAGAMAGVSGNAVAAVVELQPQGDARRAGVVAAVAMSGGVALGPLLAGVVGQYLVLPLVLPYLVEVALVLGIIAALVTMPGGRAAKPGGFKLAMPGVPPGIRVFFAAAGVTAGIGWAACGLYLGLVPSYLVALSHLNNIALGGLVVSLMLASGGVAQLLLRRLRPLTLEVGGLLAGVAGMVLLLIAFPIGSVPLLLVAAVLTGIGCGAPFLGALHQINRLAPTDARANVISCYFAVAYICTGLPIVAIGAIASRIGLFNAIRGFALILSLLALLDILLLVVLARRDAALNEFEQVEVVPEAVIG